MRFFLGLVANFYHLMLVINSIKRKDYVWQKFILKKGIRYEFFDTNYLKCSNNFAAYCILVNYEKYKLKGSYLYQNIKQF